MVQKPRDSHLARTKTVSLKVWPHFIFKKQDQNIKLETSIQQAERKKLTASVLMNFVLFATLCLKQWVASTTFVPVKSCAHLSLNKISNEAVGEDELRRSYIQEKGFTVIEMWECEWWRVYKATTNVKLHIRKNFPNRRSLTEQQLLEGIKKGSLFGYVQGDIEVPENLRVNFANFPPIFKNTLVSMNDIGDLMKMYTEGGGIMSQPRKMLISSFTLQNGTLITPLLLFYLQLGLVVVPVNRYIYLSLKEISNPAVKK